MEEQVTTTPTPPTQPTQTPKKDPFSIIGKIAIALIIIVLLVGGGIVLGRSLNKPQTNNSAATVDNISPTVSPATGNQTTPTPRPTTVDLVTFKGGLGTDTTSFKPYFFQASKDWIQENETTEVTNKITITKDDYSISVYQAPMGGAMCIYPGDEEGDFKQMYTRYKEFTGKNGEVYRRSWDEKGQKTTYTFCQKSSEGTFGTFTTYGAVTATSPNPPDENILEEIDTIISTLIPQQ